jgi:riboflavin synthase
VAKVARVADEGEGRRVHFDLPEALARFVAEKGSLAIDGVSLTVAACAGSACEVAYVPHTLAVTTAASYRSGDRVNLEVDVIARYVARLQDAIRANGGPS